MKYGIYYSYWEIDWLADFLPYISKVKSLGFDILEVTCAGFDKHDLQYFHNLRNASEKHGIILTGGYGADITQNIASADSAVIEKCFAFYKNIFPKMQIAGIKNLGGGIYHYWPAKFNADTDKPRELLTSINNMKRLADLAAQYDITLNMEVLNRFESYLINTASEGISYVEGVGKSNVKLMLDTFHMNIEEDDVLGAIRFAGKHLGQLHIGEANRRPPRPGRMPWQKIGAVLKEIGFDGNVVMEPFVLSGGQIGMDICVWREMAKRDELDRLAAESVAFIRKAFENGA